MKISASLVLYHNDPRQFALSIESFLKGSNGILYIVDNSNPPLSHELFSNPRVRYTYTGKNLGFGKAHNLAINMAIGTSDVHLLLNPDIIFEPNVLPTLVKFLQLNSDVGAIMPRINYPDGSLQRLCKLLPSPVDLIFRRFIPSKYIKNLINKRYEMHSISQDSPSYVPSLSGCFLLSRTNLLKKIGGFDERFFMYMEDVDLVRRIGDTAKIVYLPTVQAIHSYAKGSYRNKKLLSYHLISAVKYFFKWGWLFDKTRSERNRIALNTCNRKEA